MLSHLLYAFFRNLAVQLRWSDRLDVIVERPIREHPELSLTCRADAAKAKADKQKKAQKQERRG